MYCCDICGKPMFTKYLSISIAAHKYVTPLHGGSKWVHEEPVEGYHVCVGCAEVVDSIFKYHEKMFEESVNES